MLVEIVILAVYAIYWAFEVFHDDKLRKVRNALRKAMKAYPEIISDEAERRLNEEWHTWDWRAHALLACLVSGVTLFFTEDFTNLLLPIAIGLERMLILNIGLSIMADLENKFHLGEGSIDGWLYDKFGDKWPIPVSLAWGLCVVVMLIF